MTKVNYRVLKIGTKFRSRTFDNMTIPEIRLAGKWLESLGFKKGQKVKILQEKQKLTITISNNISPKISKSPELYPGYKIKK